MKQCIFWHRRDLRIEDNAALYYALRSGCEVIPIFIFDTNILDELPRTDLRVQFIHQHIELLVTTYKKLGCNFQVFHGKPFEVLAQVCTQFGCYSIYTNKDYEPYALQRDAAVAEFLASEGGMLHTYKDHVIFEENEVTKDDGKPYTVFTPYSKKWKAKLNNYFLRPYPVLENAEALSKAVPAKDCPTLQALGFETNSQDLPKPDFNEHIISNYHATRDIPSIEGTSRLGIHLRFGTISIRALAQHALLSNEKFLNELIWRDFYQQILWHFPHVVGNSFKPAYDRIAWRNNKTDFEAWRAGKTGYPLVDAGMRELNTTGWMHNRVRMVVASFLTKHLLIDWRWGEAYFAEKLIDFELASNNGGWQWASGSGVDAAPYFRVFNPALQLQKFDGQLAYVKKWVPEYGELSYQPIVDHSLARERCLQVYKQALSAEN
ncbi:MAG: hypothetical protein RL660_507 [Bacteroidota bacterium]